MKIFSGSASKLLTEDIAKELNIPLSLIDVHIFPDGERRIRIHDKVKDRKAIVVQSTATPVDTNYMELFFIIDALKRSGAKSVTAVIPYFGYQRQDHIFRDGEAISLEVIIKLLESIGVDQLVSIDMHNAEIPKLFHVPISHVSALTLFAEEINKNKWNNHETILLSPDKGGLKRIQMLSQILGQTDFAAIEKHRDRATGDLTMEMIDKKALNHKKRAIIVDDMISSANTIIMSANLLSKQGVEEIIVFATHAIFSSEAPAKLQQSSIKNVFVTNSVAIPNNKLFPKLRILSIAETIAKAVKNL